MVAADAEREVALAKHGGAEFAGAGGEFEDVGLALLGQAPAGGVGADLGMRPPEVAVVSDAVTQLDQRLGQTGDPECLRSHAAAAHRGAGGGGDTDEVDTARFSGHNALPSKRWINPCCRAGLRSHLNRHKTVLVDLRHPSENLFINRNQRSLLC